MGTLLPRPHLQRALPRLRRRRLESKSPPRARLVRRRGRRLARGRPQAAYSYLDGINERPGAQQSQQLAYRPPHRLFLRLARRGDRVEGYAETSFTSRMPRNQYGSAFLSSQLLFNAGAGARVAGPLWLDVEAKNLLADETLEDVFQYPLPGLSIAVIARARL